MAGGLIEQQHRRLLRQGARQQNPLQLAAAQSGDLPFSQVQGVGQSQRFFPRRPVTGMSADKPALMSKTPKRNHLPHGKGKSGGGTLRHRSRPARQRLATQASHIAPLPQHPSAARGQQTAHQPQQGRLAAAAGTDDDDQFAVNDIAVDTVNDFEVAVGFPDTLQFHFSHLFSPESSIFRSRSYPGRTSSA